MATPLGAQQTIGRATRPSVSVDYGVLESLGRAPTLPSLLLGGNVRQRVKTREAGAPRFPVLRGGSAMIPTGRVVLTQPGKKRATRKATKRKRRTARRTTPRRKTAKVSRRKTASAPRRASPERIVRTRIPPPTTPPKAPTMPPMPVPLTPVPKAPTPPSAVASLPPPPALPTAPAVGMPPPAPTSKPVIKPRPVAKPKPAPKRVAKPKPAPRKPVRAKPARPKPVRTASVPRKTATRALPRNVQVLFDAGSAKLNTAATASMKRVADSMKSDTAMRIQLLAYAGGATTSASQARRLSLSRALAARSYLISRGVRSTRIDVRALGNKSTAGPPDRIDLKVVRR
ncbi:MAG: OmpA family protein [Alphaproteobacteria bacterium]